MAAVYHSCG